MKTPRLFVRHSYIIGVAAAMLLAASMAAASGRWQPTRSTPGTFYQLPQKGAADSPLLDSLLHSDPRLARVMASPRRYELQIIYTQIDRDARNTPHFTAHTFNLNARQYFNPASLVKLPVAALALEKLNRLNKPGVNRRTIMATGTSFRCQTPVRFAAPADSDRAATVGNYIKRMLLVSDNVAYNRLYEFLGQRPLNDRLSQLGYSRVRITRRFAPCDTIANRHTNPISFHSRSGDTLYKEEGKVNPRPFLSPLGQVLKGRGYQAGGRIINSPYDFTSANHLPLSDVTLMLRCILFPGSVPEGQCFSLTPDNYSFLRYYLHATPHSSAFRPYSSPAYFDAYKKYLYYGRRPRAVSQPGLRIYNVVGMSHGYLADVAYFADSLNNAEFMLSAVIYVNQDGIINDGAYEYSSVGLPFLSHLGQLIRHYEARRPRQVRPQLAEFFSLEQAR